MPPALREAAAAHTAQPGAWASADSWAHGEEGGYLARGREGAAPGGPARECLSCRTTPVGPRVSVTAGGLRPPLHRKYP
jgi:hypothetical protein